MCWNPMDSTEMDLWRCATVRVIFLVLQAEGPSAPQLLVPSRWGTYQREYIETKVADRRPERSLSLSVLTHVAVLRFSNAKYLNVFMNLGLGHVEKPSTPHYVLKFLVIYMEAMKPLNEPLDSWIFFSPKLHCLFSERVKHKPLSKTP